MRYPGIVEHDGMLCMSCGKRGPFEVYLVKVGIPGRVGRSRLQRNEGNTHMKKRIALLCLALFASLTPVDAAEYFVGTRGSDAADGLTRGKAFATIQKGVDGLKPGDALTILPGEYHESVRRDKLGSAEKETRIRAEIPGTVLLRGDVTAPAFRKLDGRRFVYAADFDPKAEAQAVNEIDTRAILESMPNATELEFVPGKFHQDRDAGKLYVSTSDMKPVETHTYTVSVIPTHGFYLSNPKRVIVEGLAVTGFHAAKEIDRRDFTLNSTWGMFIVNGNDCVIRDCRAYLNAQGIGMNSRGATSGDNAIERCVAWANGTQYGVGDRGGLTLVDPRRDEIRDSVAFLNRHYGVNIRGGGREGQDERNRSFLRRNLAWGNGKADVKVKTGYANVHATVRCVAGRASNAYNPVHCLLWHRNRDITGDNIVLDDEKGLDLHAEFADPDNHDYRLQATSRFRHAAPDGRDRGPFPYKKNIFYMKPNGDDTADGLSVAGAWKTLARGVKGLRPGDTLYLEAGTYQADLDLRLQGREGAIVSIRGRGKDAVVIAGRLRVKQGSRLEFKRLSFGEDVSLDGGRRIGFSNCRFSGKDVGLGARGVAGLAVSHCAFSGSRKAALALQRCSGADLRGNLYDNVRGVGVSVDRTDAIEYSDYNGYRNTDAAWEVGGKTRPLAGLRNTHDHRSREPAAFAGWRFAPGKSKER